MSAAWGGVETTGYGDQARPSEARAIDTGVEVRAVYAFTVTRSHLIAAY
jgi:hypothetical protein